MVANTSNPNTWEVGNQELKANRAEIALHAHTRTHTDAHMDSHIQAHSTWTHTSKRRKKKKQVCLFIFHLII